MAWKPLRSCLDDPIEDAAEETFLLFSQPRPSHDLGFVNGKAGHLEVEIAGRTLEFKQSPGLLNSDRHSGTTGAVLWNLTPLIGEWLASSPQWLQDTGVLRSSSTVVELGCGITGLLGVLVAHKVSNYILTDQGYVLKVLRENVRSNTLASSRGSKKQAGDLPSNLHIIELDWEIDSPAEILQDIPHTDHVDLIVVCDCVYNEHLIRPLIQTLTELCKFSPPDQPTTVMVAQQFRSDTVMEAFLEALLQHFTAWRLPDTHLPDSLQTGSGYVVHFAQLKYKVDMSK